MQSCERSRTCAHIAGRCKSLERDRVTCQYENMCNADASQRAVDGAGEKRRRDRVRITGSQAGLRNDSMTATEVAAIVALSIHSIRSVKSIDQSGRASGTAAVEPVSTLSISARRVASFETVDSTAADFMICMSLIVVADIAEPRVSRMPAARRICVFIAVFSGRFRRILFQYVHGRRRSMVFSGIDRGQPSGGVPRCLTSAPEISTEFLQPRPGMRQQLAMHPQPSTR